MGFATKHLSEGQRRSIAESLFKVTSVEEHKGELHGLCPIHQETNPSFSYNFKKDSYNCFSCGAGGDLLRLWTELKGLGQKDGFKAFCAEFGIEPGGDQKRRAPATKGAGGEAELDPTLVLERMRTAWESWPPLPDAWIKRLEKERGWSRQWIEILDLRLQTSFLNKKGGLSITDRPDRIAIPVRDRDGTLVNVRLYRPGSKQYKIISFAKSTGASRLFPARPAEIDMVVLLCEGESDTICALSHGFNAITQTSKLKNWPAEHLEPFRDRNVVIAYDADQPGQKYARFAAQALAGTAKSVRIIRWPSFMGVGEDGSVPKDHGQDLTDFFVTHKRTKDDLFALIEGAEKQEAAPAPAPPAGCEDIARFYSFGINNRYSFKPRLLAEALLEEEKLLSDPGTGLMYRWNGKYWENFDEDHVRARAIRYLGNESQKGRIEDAVYQVRMLSTLPHGRKINDHDDWICLQNGVLNLFTFELIPHEPDLYFTQILPVHFDPESTKRCERFEQYLETNIGTPEVIAQLQEFTGYCLVRNANYEKCVFLLGPGGDGKSRYMLILRELVGHENCSAVSFSDIEDHFQRSALYNKMVNLSAEIGSNMIESEYFKKITSGDTINAAFKHRDAFDFTPYCKLVFAGNTLPRVKDNSDGFFRRILPIQFKKQFREGDPDRDPKLLDKFKEELSEIFFWALCGLKRLVEQQRFTDCQETRQLLMGYRRANNPILCYVEDECALGDGDEFVVSKGDLYAGYRKYCNEGGYMAVNKENFFRELYTAIKNLERYRPRVEGGGRETMIKGIKIVGQMIG